MLGLTFGLCPKELQNVRTESDANICSPYACKQE
jgi:hypothetical protein